MPDGAPLAAILDRAAAGETLAKPTSSACSQARGDEFAQVCEAADRLRRGSTATRVSYVVTRNINYTNVCYFRCQFCAFSKGKLSDNLRGRPYDLELDEIQRRVEEAWERGATEVCLQGGIHPEYTGATYLEVCRAIKEVVPDIHVHAFSPLEVWQGAKTLGRTVPDFLRELKEAGLGSLPGTAAEILDDEVRAHHLPRQDQDRAMARSDGDRACGRAAQHRHHHVRPCRALRALGAASAAPARAAGADRRLHRVRAAAVRADGDADLSEGPRPPRRRPTARRC